jgi:hypothetical protein
MGRAAQQRVIPLRNMGEHKRLFVFSDAQNDFEALKSELESEYGDWVIIVAPLYPQVAEAFRTDKPFNVLLRPDCTADTYPLVFL